MEEFQRQSHVNIANSAWQRLGIEDGRRRLGGKRPRNLQTPGLWRKPSGREGRFVPSSNRTP